MKPFHIIHLSDLHLTRKDNAARSQVELFSALRGMNASFRKVIASSRIQGADLVVVTGDVTDRGDEASWRVFWRGIDDAGLRDRTLVVPGNHDVCCLGLRLPGKRVAYKEADLLRAKKGLSLGGQETRFPWARQVDSRIVVFGLNSNNLGNHTALTNALGELGYNQLAKFARLLYVHRAVPVKLLLLHHSPNMPKPETSRRRGQKPYSDLEVLGHQIPQEQRQALRLLCITNRVRLVLHGHLHRAEDRRVDSVRFLGAAASTEPSEFGKNRGQLPVGGITVHGNGGRLTRHQYWI